MTYRWMLVAMTIALAGCASHPDPIIDRRGVDMAQYEEDLAECKGYAEEVNVTGGAARGGALGAVVGGVTGAISGQAAEGAGYGGIAGATRSGLEDQRSKEQIVKECIAGRGYRVLNLGRQR